MTDEPHKVDTPNVTFMYQLDEVHKAVNHAFKQDLKIMTKIYLVKCLTGI